MRQDLQPVSFCLGEVVYEFAGQLDYVYFPTTSIVSLLYTMENGSTAEMGLTGNDGVVGIALFMGGGTMPNRAVVQSAGAAMKMKAKVLQDEFAKAGKFQQLLLRYTPGTDYPDLTDRSLQSASFGRAATMSLAVAKS